MLSCSLTCLLAILHLVTSISEHPKLLLISLDGFRYDALNKTLVPNIYAFAREGTWFVNGVKPQFVTFTYTNHMAMATVLLHSGNAFSGRTENRALNTQLADIAFLIFYWCFPEIFSIRSLLEPIDGVNNMCMGDYIDLSKVIYGEQMVYLRDKSIFHEVYQNLTNAV
uniref:Sulfatase domain-containing protein n=1 Tax=Angiostrongylus cantonensis TaxID=6313 RepID=A0A0K0DAB0_ANGCA